MRFKGCETPCPMARRFSLADACSTSCLGRTRRTQSFIDEFPQVRRSVRLHQEPSVATVAARGKLGVRVTTANDCRDRRIEGPNRPQRLDTVEDGHGQVEEHQLHLAAMADE